MTVANGTVLILMGKRQIISASEAMEVIGFAMIFIPGGGGKLNKLQILEKESNILAKLNSTSIQTKLNKVTGEMEPYMKEIDGEDYKLILKRHIGEGFSNGEPDYQNLEVQSSAGKVKFDRHIYIDNDGNIIKISDYIPQRRGSAIRVDVYDKNNN